MAFLNLCIDQARHILLHRQSKCRWSWFLSRASQDTSESAEWARWFTTQRINPQKFASDLKCLLTMNDFKRNCLRLWGPASTGKTLVIKAIASHFLAHYQGMCGAHSDFAHEGFINVAVAVVEEVFLLPKEADDWKSLMCGQNLSVNNKYKPKQQIKRTPILMTSNHYKLGRGYLKPHDETAFHTRMFDYPCNNAFEPKFMLTGPGFSRYISDVIGCNTTPSS